MRIQLLKSAISGLRRDGFEGSTLWKELVSQLIDLMEIDESYTIEDVNFWKNKLEEF
jgi:hypothetical protein